MTIEIARGIISKGIMLILLCSAPAVMLGLLIGFLVALFQAVTQIQEQTLSYVPKMVTVMLVIIVTFPWMSSLLLSFSRELWMNLPAYMK